MAEQANMLDGMPMAVNPPSTADHAAAKDLSLDQGGRLGQENIEGSFTRPSESHVEPNPQSQLEIRDAAVNRASSTTTTEHSTLNTESTYPIDHHRHSSQPSFPIDPLNSLETSLGALQTDAAPQTSPSLPPGAVNLQAFLDSYSARNQENTKAESSVYHVPGSNGSMHASSPNGAQPHRPAPAGDGKNATQPAPSNPLQNVANLPNVPFIQAASISHPLPNIPPPLVSRRGNPSSHGSASNANARDEGAFPPDLERAFEEFLHDESVNVSEGSWEKFPDGSRLFIGNLPSEKVSKRDVFQKFSPYGKLAQISIKQAYGFVQFLTVEACARAKEAEQDMQIKGRKMHLEISKPQGKSGGARDRNGRRRSRSPDRDRRGDRYTGTAASPRDREPRRGRDDYRPQRSPSPRSRRRGRSPDHYDGRRRSRSRSPFNRNGRQRDARRDDDDDLPLPRRAPRDVPDVQIIVLDDLDRNFIAYIETAFKDRSLRCDVLLLSPRLSEAAVIRRQVLEGVLAVVRLTRENQGTGKLSLQLFDRREGADKVKFEQYEGLDPPITAELVLRAKQTHSQPPHSTPSQGASYGLPANYGVPQPTAAPPSNPADVSGIIQQLGGQGNLQGLIAALQQGSQGALQGGNAAALATPDIAQLLAASTAQQYAGFGSSQNPSTPQSLHVSSFSGGHHAIPGAPAAGASTAGTVAMNKSQAPVVQPDMQELMAQLSKYNRTG